MEIAHFKTIAYYADGLTVWLIEPSSDGNSEGLTQRPPEFFCPYGVIMMLHPTDQALGPFGPLACTRQ